MEFKITNDAGLILDATVEIEPGAVTLQGRSGAKGSKPGLPTSPIRPRSGARPKAATSFSTLPASSMKLRRS